MSLSPLQLIFLGGFLLLLGVIIPFLMVTQVIEPTFTLSFFSHFSSMSGMIIGFWGIITYDRARNK